MKKPRKQPTIIFYDGIPHKVGEAPEQLVEDILIERWARRMERQHAQGSSWFTIRLRTWFELGMDDWRLLASLEKRARTVAPSVRIKYTIPVGITKEE
jgi:hypothetical protein